MCRRRWKKRSSPTIARPCEATQPDFDEAEFAFAYNALGAQRNTKILGIFVRLAHRDGKPQYLAHLPRIWGYLQRNLRHVTLAPLAAWYDKHFPVSVRGSGSCRCRCSEMEATAHAGKRDDRNGAERRSRHAHGAGQQHRAQAAGARSTAGR